MIQPQFLQLSDIINNMFCCTKKESHLGEVINVICLEQQCSKTKNQLCCIHCLQEDHSNHHTSTFKKIMPDLLSAHKEKERYHSILMNLLHFVCQNFGEENCEGETTITDTIGERVKQIIGDLKKQVEMNNEEIGKMKNIFKNLNKYNPTTSHMAKSNIHSKDEHGLKVVDLFTTKKSPSTLNSRISDGLSPNSPLKQRHIGHSIYNNGEIDLFSHNFKHPYLTISSDLKTVCKSSHSGHRFAALCGKALSPRQNQIKVRIDHSVSGNIMIGLCHESIVKDKQFVNCYGANTGSYLIGQNSNSAITAISFHHNINLMNRKEIVGWNFQEGDQVTVGINFQEDFIYFKKDSSKKGKVKDSQFSMKIKSQDNIKADLQQIIDQGFKFIVLLQTEGDEVTLVD